MIFRLLAATGAAVVLLALIDPALCRADQVTYNLTPLGNPSSGFSATLTENGYVAADGENRVDFELMTSGPYVTSVYFNWDASLIPSLSDTSVDPSHQLDP